MKVSSRLRLFCLSAFIASFTLLASAGLPSTMVTISCSTIVACVFGENVGSSNQPGQNFGVEGTSKANFGIVGITLYNPTTAGTGKAGVVGLDSSTNKNTYNAGVYGNSASATGVKGVSTSGLGVAGVSSSNHGVDGTSGSSFGVVGRTSENSISPTTARAGVLGTDISTNQSFYNSGVAGVSNNGIGALGETAQGVAIEGLAVADFGFITRPKYHSIGVYGDADQGPGVYGYAHGNTSDSYGLGAYADQPGITALFSEANGDHGSTFYARTHADGYLMVGSSFESGNVLSIDGLGNIVMAGTLTQNGAAISRTRRAVGSDVATFGERSSSPTIEDMGEAQLINGQAQVRFDETFASTIDQSAKYLVFLTPRGDNRGLYVAETTPRGFFVRESNGGRATIAFDYRIVAKPYANGSVRLPSMSDFARLLHDVRPPLLPH